MLPGALLHPESRDTRGRRPPCRLRLCLSLPIPCSLFPAELVLGGNLSAQSQCLLKANLLSGDTRLQVLDLQPGAMLRINYHKSARYTKGRELSVEKIGTVGSAGSCTFIYITIRTY